MPRKCHAALSQDNFFTRFPSLPDTERRRRRIVSSTLDVHMLDRVNVLGNDADYGHTGCVNALNWAMDGEILLTGGDDRTVRIWKMDPSNLNQQYPFVCHSVIQTGHRANIFNAKMLPLSSRIVTAAGDRQVRVFDVNTALSILKTNIGTDDLETTYSASQSCIRVLRCHRDSVKKIITESSPDLFLSLSEDGTVRQHDLRTTHACDRKSCPAPLIDVGHDLSTLSYSPLVPYQLVVAGEGPYGYLYDRRYSKRSIESRWGMVPKEGAEVTTCVRKFGRDPKQQRDNNGREHITGSRISQSNGHEVLLTYSGDGVYLFSTTDQPRMKDNMTSNSSPILMPNKDLPQLEVHDTQMDSNEGEGQGNPDRANGGSHELPPDSRRLVSELFNEGPFDEEVDYQPSVPLVLPRCCYAGAKNIMTVKDVNFMGPDDQWVVSGSDDGNFFIWNKRDKKLKGIYEGDGTVVNVIEGHPHFPLLAVSGIDTTVKLFSPTQNISAFSKIDKAEQIMEENQRIRPTRILRYNLATLLNEVRSSAEGSGEARAPIECIGQ